WEPTLPANAPRELDVPDGVLLLATDIAAIDHVDGSVWLIANAVNADAQATGIENAYADAVARIDAMQAALQAPQAAAILVEDADAPEPAVRQRTEVGGYEKAVKHAKEAIRDGEVFQVVPSQRFDVDCPADPFDVYRVLRTLNPSPYMYCLSLADAQGREFAIVGASPESLVTVKSGGVLTFPIAGS